jgi:hypothetical protein
MRTAPSIARIEHCSNLRAKRCPASGLQSTRTNLVAHRTCSRHSCRTPVPSAIAVTLTVRTRRAQSKCLVQYELNCAVREGITTWLSARVQESNCQLASMAFRRRLARSGEPSPWIRNVHRSGSAQWSAAGIATPSARSALPTATGHGRPDGRPHVGRAGRANPARACVDGDLPCPIPHSGARHYRIADPNRASSTITYSAGQAKSCKTPANPQLMDNRSNRRIRTHRTISGANSIDARRH